MAPHSTKLYCYQDPEPDPRIRIFAGFGSVETDHLKNTGYLASLIGTESFVERSYLVLLMSEVFLVVLEKKL